VTYNGLNQSEIGFTATGLVNNETTYVLTAVTAIGRGTNPGNYNVVASGIDNNYHLTFVPGKLAIAKANATVTGNSANVTYNGLKQSQSGFSATGLVNGQTASVLTGVTATGSGTNAGNYNVVASGTNSNYNLTFTPGVLAIAPANATVTGNSASVTYNGQKQSQTGFSTSGLVNGQTAKVLTGITATGSGTNAGNYDVVASGTDNNYNLTFAPGQLTIKPLTLIGTLAGSSVYGAELFYSPVIFKNLITGDSVSPASPITVTNFTEGHMSTSGHLNAGTYVGVESVGSGLVGKDASNYSFLGATGNYTVHQLALTGSIQTGSSVYGQALKPGAVTFTNVISGDQVSSAGPVTVKTLGHLSKSGHLNAGTYNGIESVSSRLSGNDASNYLLSGLKGAYKVSKLDLTVKANNQSRYYGVVNPIFTETITGFVKGENKSVVTGKAIGINTANKKTLPGTSVITASNKGLSAANYTFNKLINGVLEIK
jgi:hypothetical protein